MIGTGTFRSDLLMNQQKIDQQNRDLASTPSEMPEQVAQTPVNTESDIVSQEKFVPQTPAQSPVAAQPQVEPIDVSGIRNVAAQESQGAERIIQQADIEASALQKKNEADQKAIEDQIKREESVLAEENEKVKNFKFDDRSLWSKSTTGQKIMLMVGGFLSAMNNQSAAAFRDNIQKTIDQDLALQNKQLDELKDQTKMRESLLGQLRMRLGDKDKANLAYQNLIYSKMGAQLGANAEKYKSKMIAEKAALGAAEAMTAAETKRMELQQKATEKPKLGAEAQQRLDNAKLALNGIQRMKQALDKGEDTFTVVGDNNFTLGQADYVEGLGRMQSGGAIGEEEQRRFKNFTPKATDSSSIQKTKLQKAEAELRRRIQALEGTTAGNQSYFKAK